MPSEERLLDAEEIETVAKTLQRPTARMQLESLAKKLRREASALEVVESQNNSNNNNNNKDATPTTSSTPTVNLLPTTQTTTSQTIPPKPVALGPTATPANTTTPTATYTPIDRFAFDAGGYSDPFVTLYVPIPGVGTIPKEQITCHFETAAFDLIVSDPTNSKKSYRLKKDQLEHDIIVKKSKIIIKSDKIIVKLAKVKGDYGSFDYWSKLTDPKRNEKKKNKDVSNPAASITELMRDMYESGDDNMRKMIGETMMKQQRGELGKGTDSMGMGGMDSLRDDDL
jgi:calcyclin binding protein